MIHDFNKVRIRNAIGSQLLEFMIELTKLHDLLAAGKWQEADQETTNVMLQAAGRTEERFLDLDACHNFHPEDLRTIDQLWLKYSNDKFGFSVQKKIWVDKGGKLDGSYDGYQPKPGQLASSDRMNPLQAGTLISSAVPP